MKPAAVVTVTAEELPLTCPPKQDAWNLHPRVYLHLKPGCRSIVCPYCGTCYRLAGEDQSGTGAGAGAGSGEAGADSR